MNLTLVQNATAKSYSSLSRLDARTENPSSHDSLESTAQSDCQTRPLPSLYPPDLRITAAQEEAPPLPAAQSTTSPISSPYNSRPDSLFLHPQASEHGDTRQWEQQLELPSPGLSCYPPPPPPTSTSEHTPGLLPFARSKQGCMCSCASHGMGTSMRAEDDSSEVRVADTDASGGPGSKSAGEDVHMRVENGGCMRCQHLVPVPVPVPIPGHTRPGIGESKSNSNPGNDDGDSACPVPGESTAHGQSTGSMSVYDSIDFEKLEEMLSNEELVQLFERCVAGAKVEVLDVQGSSW